VIISDTHIPERAGTIPIEFIEFVNEYKPDFLLHLGDFTELEVYEYLQKNVTPRIYAVSGNMDSLELDYRLPDHLAITLPDTKIRLGMVHGHSLLPNKSSLVEFAKKLDVKILCYGHTHIPDLSVVDGIVLLNPGSLLNGRFRAQKNSFCVMEINRERIMYVNFYDTDTMKIYKKEIIDLNSI